MNAHTLLNTIALPATMDPARAAVVRHRMALELSYRVSDNKIEGAELLAHAECVQSLEALNTTEPTTIDGVIAYLDYLIEEINEGCDIDGYGGMLESAIRGLRKMRAQS